MPAEIQVNVNLNETQAKSSIASIEQAYQHLKKELEKPVKVKVDETPLQKQINAITGVSNAARSAAKSYESMAKAEVSATQKIIAEQKKLEIQQKRLENRITLDQMKQRGKQWEQEEKAIQKIQAEYKKLNDTLDVQKSKSQSSSKQEAFKGYLDRVKQEEEALKEEKRIQAEYRKLNAEMDAERAKSQNATKQDTFKGYLDRVKQEEEFLKEEKRIQEEYKKLNAEMDAEKSKQQKADAKETFKGYLERAAAMEKETKAAEKLAQAHDKMGQSLGKIDATQATSLRTVTDFIRQQDGLANATVKATGIIRNSAGTFQTYSVSTQNADNTTQNFRASVNTATGEVQMLDQGVKSASVSFKGFGTQAMSFMKQIVGFYGVAQTLRKAFTEMKAMNDELVTYRKVTGASAADVQKMQSAAYSAAKNYGQSPSDFLASAATMARAGYKENSAAMAELATKTQLVGDMTADQASKFLIAVDAAYKYQGNIKQLSSVLDSANEIDNKYATTIEKISEGMTLVASVASTAEVPIEQLMAALGTMTAVTQREGSEAARGLRYILLHAMGDTTTEIEDGVTATEEGIQTLNEAVMQYGDEAAKAALKAGKMINPMEKIVALQKAWKEGTLSKESLYDIGLKVAGQRQYNMFMALIQNPDMYNSMMKDIANSAGSADKEWQAMMDSWSKKLEKLKATFTELVNDTISTDFIKSLIDAGTGALEFAGNLENLATMATGAYAAIKALGAGMSNLSKNRKFGGFNAASIGIGLAITAVGAIKSAYEANQRQIEQSAVKAAENAQKVASEYTSILDIQKRYQEIAIDGIQEEKGEVEELKSLQDQLNSLVGDQGTAVDLVNGKYETQIGIIKRLSEEQKKATIEKLNIELASAVAAWSQADINGTFNFGDTTGISQVIPQDFLMQMGAKYWDKYKYLYGQAVLGEGMELHMRKEGTQEGALGALAELEMLKKDLAPYAEKYPAFYNALVGFEEKVKETAEPLKQVANLIDTLMKDVSDTADTTSTSTEQAAKGFNTVSESASTLANAIKEATSAKTAFDKAMQTSKADAFNDYVKAFETLEKEMKAGRVNSTAFYAAAQMILGEEKYNATGGTSYGVMNAINMRTAGDSGSAYDAWKILTDTYTNNKTGEAIEGFGFAELLRRTKGWGEAKITDANGNIVIPNLTSDQIAEIANAWHIDSAFLMAAWNAFDQYDVQGTRAEDDLMVQENKDAEEKSNAEKALTDSTNAAASAMVIATGALESLAASANKAASELGGEGAEGGNTEEEPPGMWEAPPEAVQAIDDAIAALGNGQDISMAEAYPELAAGYEERKNAEAAAAAQAAREEAAARAAARAAAANDPALQAVVAEAEAEIQAKIDANKLWQTELPDWAKAAAEREEAAAAEDEADISFADYYPELASGYAQAGEEAGKAFAEAEAAAAEDEADISFADYYPELASGYAQAGEEAGKQFGAEYWNAMIQTADRYGQGMDIPDNLRKQLEEDLAENGGDLWAVIEKYKKALADAKSEAEDLNDELGGTEEKDVEVDVKDDEAKEKVSDITKDVHKKVFIDIINRSTPNGGGGGGGNTMAEYASGTRSHAGGPALVNDGSGPELIVQGGQAFIAGGGKPTVVGLQKGAKVFTAGETRSILGGSGIPAYADGTEESDTAHLVGVGTTTVNKFSDVSSSSKKNISASLKKEKDKSKNKSSKSAKKVDDKAFTNLASVVDYIIGRIGTALDEQLDVIDSQIDALKAARDAAEEQNKLEELQKNVTDALNERTVRYLGEDGKWHWMADQKNVQQAQKALKEYEDDLAFNAQVKALEDQKKALQKEYDQITKMWGEIKDGVNTPTTSLSKAISAVLEGGTAQQKTGAKAVQSSLIGEMTGSVYKKNYKEALSSISKAASGKPIMPNSGNPSLASLIAMSGLGSAGSSVTQALKTATSNSKSMTGSGNTLVGGNQTNINYFIDGIKLGQDMQNQPLSTIMRNLGVYTNTGVS